MGETYDADQAAGIVVQLLNYWYEPSNPPFPSKKDLAERIGLSTKTIQVNIRELEKVGYIKREKRRSSAGDWNSNIYHLDGLVEKVRKLEPDFTTARDEKVKREKYHGRIMEMCEWLSPEAAAWCRHHCRFNEIHPQERILLER